MTRLIKLEGIITPLITPCLNGEFDGQSFKRIADMQLEAKIDGIFVLGTSGEFQYISLDGKKRVLDAAAENYKGKITLIAGTTCDTLEETIELTQYAQERGFDAVVLAPEYQMEMHALRYVRSVIEATQIPIVLYNYPKISNGRMLDIGVVRELSKDSRLIGVKDSSGDMEYFAQLQALRSGTFGVLQGSQIRLKESLQSELGIDGCVLGFLNIIPKETASLYRNGMQGVFDDPNWELFDILSAHSRRDGTAKSIKGIAYGMKLISSKELFPNNPGRIGTAQAIKTLIIIP